MKMPSRFATIIASLVLVSLACSFGTISDPPPGDAPASDILFQDDFSNPSSGWDSYRDSDGMTDYDSGSYRIQVNRDNYDFWANPGKNFTDVQVEVEASKSGGPDENDFGVICRYRDVDHFYFFIIGSDGFYGIGKVSAGEQQLIGMEQMNFSNTINQGEATNQIRADCVANTLTLYVNGEIVADVTDDELSSGDVGLIAGTFDEPGTDILFDNFVVRRP